MLITNIYNFIYEQYKFLFSLTLIVNSINMRNLLLLILASFLLVTVSAQSDWGEVKWDNGLRFENPDKNYKIKFGGRIMLDGISAWPEQNGVIDTIITGGSGVEFRRLRLYSAGQIYGNIKYKLQFDLAGGQGVLKDAYIYNYKNSRCWEFSNRSF